MDHLPPEKWSGKNGPLRKNCPFIKCSGKNGPFIKCSGMMDGWSNGPLGGAVSADIFIRPSACPLGRVASADSFIRPSACSLGRAASSDPVIRPSACPLGRAASAESCHGPSGLVHVFGDRHQPDPCLRPFIYLSSGSLTVRIPASDPVPSSQPENPHKTLQKRDPLCFCTQQCPT